MIVFLSDYPDELTERDGMMRRVAAIDSMFAGHRRLYLQMSFKRYKRRTVAVQGLVTVERANFFVHYRYIDLRLREASCIYVHSIFNALKPSHLWRFRHKTVFDAHGIVPEELVFAGRHRLAKVCGFAESMMVRNCGLLVVVTQKMGQHFLKKYRGRLDASRILTLPNTDFSPTPPPKSRGEKDKSPILRLIYAGGVQKWQNIEVMVETLRQLGAARQDWHASIYVPESAICDVQAKVNLAGCSGRVTVGSLPHGEVMREYARADVGFVLRDPTLFNQVAMPTKLVEYMNYGVVPIVLSPDIGDFLGFGYRFLTIGDLLDKGRLHPETLEQMRAVNSRIATDVCASALDAGRALVSFVEARDAPFSPGPDGPSRGIELGG